MPNIYITDETRVLLDKASIEDVRTLDGEINYLCQQRIKELGIHSTNNNTLSSEKGQADGKVA